MTVIGVIAQGTMGSGVGRRLRESGAEVRTLLSGRSPASAERARAAGMVAAADERALLEGADFFLSILPPGEAEPLARRLAPTLAALDRKPVYIDCNAVSPQTAIRIGEIIAPTGADFVDGGIIGGPPRPGYSPGDLRLGSGSRPDRGVARLGRSIGGSLTVRSAPPPRSRCPMPGSPKAPLRLPLRCCSAPPASAAPKR